MEVTNSVRNDSKNRNLPVFIQVIYEQVVRPVCDIEGPIRALFTDLDGTLTTGGIVEADTYAALERISQSGITVVIVTGRPAGWAQALASIAPVDAVIAENGGVTFTERGLLKTYAMPQESLAEWRQRLREAIASVTAEGGGLALSADNAYREVDMAIDWNENIHVEPTLAESATVALRKRGLAAVRSSVHINVAPGTFDKFSASQALIARLGIDAGKDYSACVFVGDSVNDASMFRGFSNSVGVANIRHSWDALPDKPIYGTRGEGGAGVRELIAHLMEIAKG